jgi:YaiO family outer membrane protein
MIGLLLVASAFGATAQDTTRPAPLPAVVEVEAEHIREARVVGGGLWTESRLRASVRRTQRQSAFVEGRAMERFGRGDGDVAAGATLPLGPRWTAGADATFAPAPVFLPRWSLGGTVALAAGGGWVPSLAVRHAEFATAPVRAYGATLDHYRGPYLVGYTLTRARVRHDEAGSIHTVRASREYGSASRVSAAASAGRTVEAVAPDDVRLLEVRWAAVWGVQRLDGQTGLTWMARWQRYESLFERVGVGVGVRRRL